MENDVLKYNTIRSKDAVYLVQNLIGTGRFSRVYQATDTTTKAAVVIKVLINKNTDTRLDNFLYLKELDLLNKIKSSPLRVRYVDLRDAIQLESGVVCFVMEQLGTTLYAVLRNVGGLPMSMCRPIVRQIAQGLVGLKCMGIVHADLKPDNIMFCAGIGNNHLVKIIDFGWAFYLKNAHTMYSKRIQAIPYRAPEVCFHRCLEHGLDLWSLGCIMPEIVTGVKLFDVNSEELLVKLITRTLAMPDFLLHNLNQDIINNEMQLPPGWIEFLNLRAKANCKSDLQKTEDIVLFKDLVYKMLVVLPEFRITAADALAHSFLTMKHFIKYPKTVMTRRNVEMMRKCALDICH